MLHYYVIDVETTGLKVDWHEISQISVIRCADRHQLSRYVRVQHPWRASPEALQVTGRTKEDLSKGILKEEAVALFDDFFREDGQTPEHRCMVGHNVSFDRRFCYNLWKSLEKVFPATCWLDTMSLTKNYVTHHLGKEFKKKTLHASLEAVGLTPRSGAHNAISDTRNTYILHHHILKQGIDHLPLIKRLPQEQPLDGVEESLE